MRLPPKMTPAQIAEAQRMAREWKLLGAPGESRPEFALDERAAKDGKGLSPGLRPSDASTRRGSGPTGVARDGTESAPSRLDRDTDGTTPARAA